MAILHWAHNQDEIPEEAANVQPFEREGKADGWSYQTHVGLCLYETERNGRDDSDFFMTVWNPKTQNTSSIEFGTTRGYCGPAMGSFVDATSEVQVAYAEFQKAEYKRADDLHQLRRSCLPARGMEVVTTANYAPRGQAKIPAGSTGRVFWSSAEFKRDRVLGILFLGFTGRVGVETASGQRFFISAGKVHPVGHTFVGTGICCDACAGYTTQHWTGAAL